MSVLDRQQITPGAPPPSVGGPSRRVPWIGVLIALLVIGLIAVGTYLLWPQAQATPETVPSPNISIPATYPETPETKDIDAAKAAYLAYDEADTRLGPDGRISDDALKDLKKLTTGKAWEYEKADAKANAKARYVFDGQSKATIKSAKMGKNGTVSLRVCIDQSNRTAVDKKGKKVELLSWISSKATMKKVGETWKLADRDDIAEQKSCA